MRHIRYTLVLFFTLILSNSFAQDPGGSSPCDAIPFCSDESYTFPNVSGSQPSLPGPSYGCLFSQPNQIWYFLKIATPGSLQLTLSQQNNNNVATDIDFAMWGPFSDLTVGCDEIMSGITPLQCSYSASSTETIGIGMTGGSGTGQSTPPPAQTGEYYIVVMTNFNNSPGTISLAQTAGTGSTDCSIINCTLEVGNTGPVCSNTPFTLWATNDTASFYEWRDPNNNIIANTAEVTTTWNQAGIFPFTMTSIIGDDTCIAITEIEILKSTYDTTKVEICWGEYYEYEGNKYFAEGKYSHLFVGSQGCDSIHVIDLTVNPLPDVEIFGPNFYEFCEGDQITFGVAGNANNITYQWFRNGNIINGETGASITVNSPGVYHVVGTTNKGCVANSSTVQVAVNPIPEVSVTNNQQEIMCTFDTVSFTATANVPVEYYWEPDYAFRNIPGNDGATVQGVFNDGDAVVTVRAVSLKGCESSAETYIYTKHCCEVNMPNAFSPDNDGLNDILKPYLRPSQSVVNFAVYDRYGKLVYQTNSSSELGLGWDGNYPNGNPAAIGTYTYILEYTCSDNQVFTTHGTVTLLR